MAIEIRELHIRINVDESSKIRSSSANEKMSNQKLIQACVEQVLEILEQKKER